MARVLVTGATGFVGRHLCAMLSAAGYAVRIAVRGASNSPTIEAERIVIGDLGRSTEWDAALADVDVVLHLAARAHVLDETDSAADLYAETNALGTLRLATVAAAAGVRRLIYVSSVKVNGEETKGRAYTAADEPDPRDAYAISKWRAEQHVREVGERSGMDFVIVRPPLVYGVGVRANFLRLLGWVASGWPLPLGAIHNQRSLVSVWNLCDFLVSLTGSGLGARDTWMVSDGEDLSTPDLVRRIASAMRKRVTLLPVPPPILSAGAALIGWRSQAARLCGSLVVDTSRTRELVGWAPPLTVDEGLARTVEWYLSSVVSPRNKPRQRL
jgi:UDP-N-acetyl-alpha-D-quinovosamine dehydrogenase